MGGGGEKQGGKTKGGVLLLPLFCFFFFCSVCESTPRKKKLYSGGIKKQFCFFSIWTTTERAGKRETTKTKWTLFSLFCFLSQVAGSSPPLALPPCAAASPRAAQALACQSSKEAKASSEKEGEGEGEVEVRRSGDEDEASAASGAEKDVGVDLLSLSPSSPSPSLSSLGIDSRALSTAASTLFIRSPRSLRNLRAAALKASQSERGGRMRTLQSSGAGIEGGRQSAGVRPAGGPRGATFDRKGASTRKDDVDVIYSGATRGAEAGKARSFLFIQ